MGSGSPRRIVFVNQFFWPDSAPTAVLLSQAARHFAAQGHEVSVICGRHVYATGKEDAPPPVQILRVGGTKFSRGAVSRILSWGTFLILAAWRLVRMGRCDVLVVMTTPPGLSIAGALLKHYLDAKLWIWEMDLYPDVLIGTKTLSPNSIGAHLLNRLLTWSRQQSDGIIALGECMKQRLCRAGVSPTRIHVAPNWAAPLANGPTPIPDSLPLRVLYSGNLGLAHEVDTVFEAMRLLQPETGIHFLFAGGGACRAILEKRCLEAGLKNVTFQAYGDERTFKTNLDSCHIGLVTLRTGCEGTVVPSKVYSLLASGRPYLFIGPSDATPAAMIRDYHCGWHYEPGRQADIAAHLRRLMANPREIAAAAVHATASFEQHFSLVQGLGRLTSIIVPPPNTLTST